MNYLLLPLIVPPASVTSPFFQSMFVKPVVLTARFDGFITTNHTLFFIGITGRNRSFLNQEDGK
jgi:hypothetical protein